MEVRNPSKKMHEGKAQADAAKMRYESQVHDSCTEAEASREKPVSRTALTSE